MNQGPPENITFQVTVNRFNRLFSSLPKKDYRVTVCVGDISKITCSGKLSWHRRSIKWKHPFLFTASPSTAVRVAICTLPENLTPEWDKQPLGDQIVTDVTSMLKSGKKWECNVLGPHLGHATLFMKCKTHDMQIKPDGHDCTSALSNYSSKLYKFAQKVKNVHCVSTNIEVELGRLDLCPLGHAKHTRILQSLSLSFDARYEQEGKIADLNRAIQFGQTRLDLCPLGHPDHTSALGDLAIYFSKHYCIQKNEADLNKLIDMQKQWLDLCPEGHPDHKRALGELAMSFYECYMVQGGMSRLNRAIDMEQKRLDLCSRSDPNYGTALGNLASSLMARYQTQGNITDLNRAIDLQENKLEVCPSGHPDHGLALQSLASSLKARLNKTKDNSDLIKAIKLLQEALDTYPVQHHHFALTVHQLAVTILFSLKFSEECHPPNQPLPLLDEAFQTYRKLKACGPAVSMYLWNATQAWVKNAEEYTHPSVLEAYQTSLNILDHFTSLNSSLDSRHEAMQARVADLANNAFSCAMRHGALEMAVELLEQGRGILWNQLSRFDICIAALESQGNEGLELGRKYKKLSTDLRKHAEGNGGKGMEPYWRVLEEWQSVVGKIRSLDGFSRFLLPPRFEDLQQAAAGGPVIIVNASEYGCEAIVVLSTRPSVPVPLPCSLDDVIQLCSDLSRLTQDASAFGENRESWVKLMLRELWSSVVEPIVTVLKNDIQLPPGSRIWWCPTSKFTILPFHAAGPHRKAEKNLMDIYVSSYAPSLSALIRTRDRIRSQVAQRSASGRENVTSFAAVGQAEPSTDMKLCQLPEVEREIERIRDETNIPPDVKFDTIIGDATTIDGAVRAFRDHHWVHLACHGSQHAKKPFESWFAMRDGKLTLARIIQERYVNSEFAFLSACHTAVGDRSTPDEVLHLAAGMQFAGFNGVIGTLWRVDDAVAHQVVTRFYMEMFRHPVIDFEYAATALNKAVVESAKDVSLEKRIVFVHIGI